MIGCVSGDGILHEVLNGLASRKDAQRGLRLPLVPVPCGASLSRQDSLWHRTDDTQHPMALLCRQRQHTLRLSSRQDHRLQRRAVDPQSHQRFGTARARHSAWGARADSAIARLNPQASSCHSTCAPLPRPISLGSSAFSAPRSVSWPTAISVSQLVRHATITAHT